MSVWMKKWKAPWSHNAMNFQPARLAESTEVLDNPARGWYQIYTFSAEVPFDAEETRWCLQAGESLVLVLIDIGYYGKCAIEDAGLENIRNILEWFGMQGKDVILRVVYDRVGKGMEREPAGFALVKMHMEQVADVLSGIRKSVFLYQGLLIGSWGEMHGSRYLVREKLVQLEQILREQAGTCFYAVRSPMLWRWLRAEPDGEERLGIFDDGMLGSETDLGTFSYEERSADSWLRPWCREDEMQFLDALCKKVPCGGEVVCPEDIQKGTGRETGTDRLVHHVEELRRMQVTYLNRVHDLRILDLWRAWNWKSADVWNGCNGYDYIGNHLGYRFVVRRAYVSRGKKQDGGFRMNIEIENVGFARLYQEVQLELEWHTAAGAVHTDPVAFDLRMLDGGNKRLVVHKITEEAGSVYLRAKRKEDGAVLYFANVSEVHEKILLGTFTQ